MKKFRGKADYFHNLGRSVWDCGYILISGYDPHLLHRTTMSPIAVYDYAPSSTSVATPSKGPALAIGSPSTARDGQYQTLVTELEASRDVEKQMLDRVVDGGMSSTR